MFALFTIFMSCNREAKKQCKAIKEIKISANQILTIGDDLSLSATEVGGFRIYNWNGPNFFDSQDPENLIEDVSLKHRGWYSLHVYTLEDETCEGFDSVFVDVLLKQGSPECTTNPNTVSFNNQGQSEYLLAVEGVDSFTNQKKLTANGISGSCDIFFHPSWFAREIQTGIYTTTNTSSMDVADGDYNKVFIGITRSNFFWGCDENQTVYVSNSNGKLSVEFCNLNFNANNGAGLSSTASGNISEP